MNMNTITTTTIVMKTVVHADMNITMRFQKYQLF